MDILKTALMGDIRQPRGSVCLPVMALGDGMCLLWILTLLVSAAALIAGNHLSQSLKGHAAVPATHINGVSMGERFLRP